MRYHRKPMVVDAWQWTGETVEDAHRFFKEIECGDYEIQRRHISCGGLLFTAMVEGNVAMFRVFLGDWVTRDGNGMYRVYSATNFEKDFEQV